MLIRLTAKRHPNVDGRQYLVLRHRVESLARRFGATARTTLASLRRPTPTFRSAGLLAKRHGLHLSVACAALLATFLVGVPYPTLNFSLSAVAADRAGARSYADDAVSSRGVSAVPATFDTALLERRALVHTTGAEYPEVKVSTYEVQEGDTLYTIADRFGLSVLTVYWANQSAIKDPDALSLGQELSILPTDGAYHVVTEGETIEGIASAYGVMPEIIEGYAGNNVSDPHQLAVGTALIVPGATLPDLPKAVVTYDSSSYVGETYTAAPSDAQPGSGQLIWPLSGIISQRASSYHMAIDIAGDIGTPVVAADSGTVTLVSWLTYSYGYHIIIDHGNGLETLYAHLSEIDVQVGQVVNQGDVIGLRGNTGRSTGPHLHFEVRENGVKRDPMSYLP